MSLNSKVNYDGATANFLSKRVVAAAAVIVVLIALIFSTYHAAKKNVFLVIDGKKVQKETFAADINNLLQESNVKLGEKDKVFPQPSEKIKDGMTVTIKRAVPITVKVADEDIKVLTAAASVGEVLKENKIALGELDSVSPAIDQPVKGKMIIQVDRITTKIVEENVEVPNNVKRETDSSIYRGIVRVVREGSKGLAVKKWQVFFKNGKETDKKLLASNIIKQPVDRIVRVGTLQTVSRGGHQIRFSKVFNMVSTAYTHTGNNTHTGVAPRVGLVAVDPSVIPMGSKLYVEGYGYCQAADVGSRIKGNRLDVFMDTRSQALKWGRRNVKVYLLE